MNKFCGFSNPNDKRKLRPFVAGYIEAALFSSGPFEFSDGTREGDFSDLSGLTVAGMVKDAERFERENEAALDECGLDRERAGQLLWYSSNGHGVGWFDDGRNDALMALHAATKALGLKDGLSVDDDDEIRFYSQLFKDTPNA